MTGMIHPHFGVDPVLGVAGPVEFNRRQALAGSAHSEAYQRLRSSLVALRQGAGLSQAGLAKRLGKPPSFVGKYELGERRLDAVELAVILRAVGTDLPAFWAEASIELPDRL